MVYEVYPGALFGRAHGGPSLQGVRDTRELHGQGRWTDRKPLYRCQYALKFIASAARFRQSTTPF